MLRLYRLLLYFYPPAFRREFAASMEQLARDRLRDESGISERVRLSLHLLADTAASLVREWGATLRPRASVPRRQARFQSDGLVSGVLSDLRFALRTFRKDTAFTGVTIVTLGLGIGATTAIFSVVNGVILRPLEFRDPDRLALIYTDLPEIGLFKLSSSGPEVLDYRDQTDVFEQIAYVSGAGGITLTGSGDAEQVSALFVSWDLFPMLGVTPARGRFFTADEDRPDGPRAVVLSHEYWQRKFGGDPGAIGRVITLSGNDYEIVGVAPPGFRIDLPPETQRPSTAEIWIPSRTDLAAADRPSHFIMPLARIAPGVTVEAADQAMQSLATRLRPQYYGRTGFELHVYSLHGDLVRRSRPALFALLGAVGFVLLIACANVANLLLARGTARERELAMRTALGATRGRVVRQIVTESAVLAVAGTLVGLLVAWGGIHWLMALDPEALPRLQSVSLDPTVLAFAAGTCVLTTMLFGLLPALHIATPNLYEPLKDSGRGHSVGRVRQRLRGSLVVTEVALSLVLLIGAGLMIRSLLSLQHVRPGFDTQNLLTFQLDLPSTAYEVEELAPFYRQLEQRIAAIPGVDRVGAVHALPLSGDYGWSGTTNFIDATNGLDVSENDFETDRRIVTPGYFEAMGAQLLRGRFFDDGDVRDAQRVTIVDATLAERVWPGADPIGRRFVWGVNDSNATFFEVVGVVEHIRHHDLASDGREQTYFPQAQFRFRTLNLVVRTALDPERLIGPIRSELRALDPNIPAYQISTMDAYVDRALAPTRFNLILLGVFAATGLVLALVGIYGVMAYTVGQRTQELGIRRALGAQHGDVMSMVLRQGLVLTGAGVAIGAAGALLLTRFVRSLLFDVAPTDPVTYVAVGGLLVAVAAFACYLPARRAGLVDPAIALREG